MANSNEQRYSPSSLVRCNLGLGLVLNRRPIYGDVLHTALPTAASLIFGVIMRQVWVEHVNLVPNCAANVD